MAPFSGCKVEVWMDFCDFSQIKFSTIFGGGLTRKGSVISSFSQQGSPHISHLKVATPLPKVLLLVVYLLIYMLLISQDGFRWNYKSLASGGHYLPCHPDRH